MEYEIKFTEQCLEDIEEICKYITENLKAENSSKRLRYKIKCSIEGLSTFPEMYAKIEKIDREKRDYRIIPIDNYVLLYTVDKKDKIVYISHLYYGGRNYLEGLL